MHANHLFLDFHLYNCFFFFFLNQNSHQLNPTKPSNKFQFIVLLFHMKPCGRASIMGRFFWKLKLSTYCPIYNLLSDLQIVKRSPPLMLSHQLMLMHMYS